MNKKGAKNKPCVIPQRTVLAGANQKKIFGRLDASFKGHYDYCFTSAGAVVNESDEQKSRAKEEVTFFF